MVSLSKVRIAGNNSCESEFYGGTHMKKATILLTVLVLTLTMLAACGCRNSKPAVTQPTTMPTTAPTTMPTTVPTTIATEPATIPDGNGPLPTDSTAPTDETVTDNARSGIMEGTGTGRGITGSITG